MAKVPTSVLASRSDRIGGSRIVGFHTPASPSFPSAWSASSASLSAPSSAASHSSSSTARSLCTRMHRSGHPYNTLHHARIVIAGGDTPESRQETAWVVAKIAQIVCHRHTNVTFSSTLKATLRVSFFLSAPSRNVSATFLKLGSCSKPLESTTTRVKSFT